MSCLTSKGYLGKCTSLHECHPFYNIKDDLPDWVFGSGEACYQSGVCCKKTSIKGGMQQRIIVPASTVLLDFGRNAISFSKPFEQDKYNQGMDSITNEVESASAKDDSGSTDFSKCGTSKYQNLKIVGGLPARQGEYPWTVALLNKGIHFCGGSIISPNHILTASHCFAYTTINDAKDLVVRSGDHDLTDDIEAVSVEKKVRFVIKNKLFDFETLHHDVAVLVLDSPLTYRSNIRPVCLPSKDEDYEGQNVTVSGWGLVTSGSRPSILQKVDLNVWSQTSCEEVYQNGPSPGGITEHMLCAGEKGKDSCNGDSGGPLVRARPDKQMEQIGIVSWGVGCGSQVYPGVYTRVTKVRDWIEKVMNSYP